MPDPTILLRVIAGESIFGVEVDSGIRHASNRLSARLMIELFHRCDTSPEQWPERFAESLSESMASDPDVLIGFDDGDWQDKEINSEDDLSPVPEPNFTCYSSWGFAMRTQPTISFRYSHRWIRHS